LLRDDAAECHERPWTIGLGECLPEERQRDAPGRLQWARGGTDRVERCRMMILPGGAVPGECGSTPPASRAPGHRLSVAAPRVHKGELQVRSVCVFCNSYKGTDIAGLDRPRRRPTPLFNPRRHEWARHFRWEGGYLIGRTPIGRVTVSALKINNPLRVELREELIEEGLFPPK
jgi:hypothetical protein